MGFQRDQPVDEFFNHRRLEIHIQRVAQQMGFDGSPYADVRPETMTLQQPFAGQAIYLELPVDLRKLPSCKEMCVRVVGSSTNPHGDDGYSRPEANSPQRPPSPQRKGRNYGRRRER